MNFKITLLPGDGIGPEVTNAAVQILQFMAEKNSISLTLTEQLMGGSSYDEHGIPITNEALNTCLDSDAVFLGAVGGPKWEDLEHHLKPEAALLKLRKSMGLYANIRPAKVFSSFLSASSLKEDILRGTDFVVMRELTGGIYFGEPRKQENDKAWNTMIYSKEEIERIAHVAFEAADLRGKKVISVDKANVLEVSQFWRNTVHEVAKNYPQIELENMYVDNAAMQIVRDPKQFDVILTSNLFGDILSDIAGMITGSLGMLPSASIGKNHALFEPVHGSAPDIAGQNKANPMAAILSIAMMFEYSFKNKQAAQVIEQAVEATLQEGYATEDIAKENSKIVSTSEMTEQVIEQCEGITNQVMGS
ncbi:MAG: 3-isopropylmalate dehydrogenase [Calditrichaeota bacterium]|nr:MAG: 3-isopropylmalate dehydrogenase [Calditrichota bacterium]MBL1205729.1 3-isopropylmalate dehydrogenase [Calditrichota bacterium]NOG45557.1 3-isopropylmalate dehydrogenase [Calditrichota bacterium]